MPPSSNQYNPVSLRRCHHQLNRDGQLHEIDNVESILVLNVIHF
jgi:hypothetical protein